MACNIQFLAITSRSMGCEQEFRSRCISDDDGSAEEGEKEKDKKKIKKKIVTPTDRLAKDKKYLENIALRIKPRTDIKKDKVSKSIRKEATEAVEYLKKREAFWEILEFGKDENDTSKSVTSYRALM